MSRTPDRCRLLALLVVASVGLLTACGGSSEDEAADSPTSAASAPSGPWSYVDGLGQTIELAEVPTRIAAYGDAAAALIGFGIKPVAIFHYVDPADDATFEDVDLEGIEIVGTSYGEIDVEQLAATQPDLIVTTSYQGETPHTMYGFKDKAQIDAIRKIAPIAGIMQTGTAADVIKANEALAATLGIDVGSGKVAEDKAAFEAASQKLTTAGETGITVLPMYAEDAGVYVAIARDEPALAYYQQLGVDFVETGGPDDYYWEELSWENADKYDPDLILYSVRDSYTPEQLMDQPTFARMPAAQAGQLHPWKFKSMDYASQATWMNELAEAITSAEEVS